MRGSVARTGSKHFDRGVQTWPTKRKMSAPCRLAENSAAEQQVAVGVPLGHRAEDVLAHRTQRALDKRRVALDLDRLLSLVACHMLPSKLAEVDQLASQMQEALVRCLRWVRSRALPAVVPVVVDGPQPGLSEGEGRDSGEGWGERQG